jgi:hypothetical protein
MIIFKELDALGDEMQEDNSYLEDLEVPDKNPSDKQKQKEENLESQLGL